MVVAYQKLSAFYGWLMTMSYEDFQHLVTLSNPVCTLLASHWVALGLIMSSIMEAELSIDYKSQEDVYGKTEEAFARWQRYLNRQVDQNHQSYNWWPLWVENQLHPNRTVFNRRGVD
jgi:hypothetical protein